MLGVHELLYSLKQHKTRSSITCVGIIWGIFILIVLLGLGNGLEKGVYKLLGNFSRNSLWIIGGQSTLGNSDGLTKPVEFDTTTLNIIRQKHKGIKYLSPEAMIPGGMPVIFQDKVGYFTIKGVGPDYLKIKMLNISEGRGFNEFDNSKKRLNVIIGKRVAKTLFKENGRVIGNYLEIDGEHFRIVGLLNDGTIFSQSESGTVFIPYRTFSERLKPGSFANFVLTWDKQLSSDQMEEQLRSTLSGIIGFDKEDKNSLFFFSLDKQIEVFEKLFRSIKVFIWFIGVSLLVSGMVGVGNVMFISVSERTKEIGIRMAVGAKPKVVLKSILAESIFLTVVAGCLGILLGVLAIHIANFLTDYLYSEQHLIIGDLYVDPLAIFGAFVALVIAGIIAGMIPARKAANIAPVEAIRFE